MKKVSLHFTVINFMSHFSSLSFLSAMASVAAALTASRTGRTKTSRVHYGSFYWISQL